MRLSIRIVSWLAFACWCAGIFALSSLPPGDLSPFSLSLPGWDKVLHAFAFALGAMLLSIALRHATAWNWARIFCVCVVAISLFGISDEWHQLHTPGRQGGDVGDWIADTLGAALGAWLTRLHGRLRTQNRAHPGGEIAPGD